VLEQQEVIERLDVSRGTLFNWERDFKIISYRDSGKRVFPAWQFVGNRVLPGLDQVLGALQVRGLEAWNMTSLPLELADDHSLYELLLAHQVDRAVSIAKQLHENYVDDED
jgi:hypothetical protein